MKKLFTKCTAFIFCSIFIAQAAVGQSIWSTDSASIWNTVLSKKVGIGTSNPLYTLDLAGTLRMTAWDAVLRSTTIGGKVHDLIGTYEGWNSNVIYIAGYNAKNTPTRHTTAISMGAEGRLWVDLISGNVGIGTTSPGTKLEVRASLPVINISDQEINPFDGSSEGKLAFGSGGVEFGSIDLLRHGTNYDDVSNMIFRTSWAGGAGGDGTNKERMRIQYNGNVGIGTTNPTQKLSVNGTIQAKEIVVNTGWSDFVFDNNYKLRSLTEIEQFVKTNKHLPEIPSQKEVEKNGVQLGDISSKLLMKIEELTLYMIEMKKENEKQKAINIKLENEIKKLQNK